MAIITLQFQFPINVSAQIGDVVYAVQPTTPGTTPAADLEEAGITNMNVVGVIVSIPTPTRLRVDTADATNPGNYPDIKDGEFIMFSKHKEAGTSGLLGYHIEAHFINDSKTHAELFSVSTDTTINSE